MVKLWGPFLSTAGQVVYWLRFPRVSRQEHGRANLGLSPKELTFLMDLSSFSVFDRYPLSPRAVSNPRLLRFRCYP
jgi:hypothetical protein